MPAGQRNADDQDKVASISGGRAARRSTRTLDRMKTLGLIVLAIFSAIGAVAVAFVAWNHYESQSSSFASYVDVKASGLIEHGWVPEQLPRSAQSIEESHDVSASVGGGSFHYDPADTTTTAASCKVLSTSTLGSKFLCPPFDGGSYVVVLRKDGTGSWTLLSDAI